MRTSVNTYKTLKADYEAMKQQLREAKREVFALATEKVKDLAGDNEFLFKPIAMRKDENCYSVNICGLRVKNGILETCDFAQGRMAFWCDAKYRINPADMDVFLDYAINYHTETRRETELEPVEIPITPLNILK